MFCSRCGAWNEEGQTPCVRCGSPLPPAPPPVDAAATVPGAEAPSPPEPARPIYPEDELIGGSVRDGWEILKRNPVIVVLVLLALLAFQVVTQLSLMGSMDGSRWRVMPFVFIFSAAMMAVYSGYLLAVVRVARGEPVTSAEFLAAFTRLPHLVVVAILTSIAVAAGYVVFIVPGIILALGWSQAFLLVLDQRAGPIEAMERSWRMMKGRRLSLLLLYLVMMGVFLISMIPLLLGLLVSIPWMAATQIAFYERVRKMAQCGNPKR